MPGSSSSPPTQTSKTPPSSPNKSLLNEDTPLKSPKKRGARGARQRKLERQLTDEANELILDREKLEEIWSEMTEKTCDCSLDNLLDLHSMFGKVIYKYKDAWDRQELIEVRII